MFKRVTGKKCMNPKCPAFQGVIDSSLNVCDECADPLTAITAVDKRATAIAGLAAILVVGGGSYFGVLRVKAYLAQKALETASYLTQPLTDAAREQVKALLREISKNGETPDAKRKRDELQRDYKVAPEDFEKLNQEVQREASATPAPISVGGDVSAELSALLRSVYADGIKTPEEQAEIEKLATKHPVERERLLQREQEIRDRLNKSDLSLKQGILYAAQKDYKQAVKEFNHALEVDSENAFAWANLASAYLNVNDQKSARDACANALRLDPRNWLAHYNLGSLYAKGGDKDAAISELTTALESVAQDQSLRITKAEIVSQMRGDQALSRLRTDSRFQQLLARK
jgi:Flp pilus assembly protein TadD